MKKVLKERFRQMLTAVKARYPTLKSKDIAARVNSSPQDLSNNLNPKRSLPDAYVRKFISEFGIRTEFYENGLWPIFEDEVAIKGYDPNNEQIGSKANEATLVYNNIIKVPVVVQKAQSTYLSAYKDESYLKTLPQVFIPRIYEKGCYRVFEIADDSMDDGSKRSICEGDEVLAKELDTAYWKHSSYHERYLFIIVHKEGISCKKIISHHTKNGFLCHSFNPLYENYTIVLSNVLQLFCVKKITERKISLY